MAFSFIGLMVVFIGVWSRSNYGSRQLLAIYPVCASVAGLGLATVPQFFERRVRRALRIGIAAVWFLIVGLSLWNVASESRGRPPFGGRTGLYAVAAGKWFKPTVAATLDPPLGGDEFGGIGRIWQRLRELDPTARVLSFDTRGLYIPQKVLSAGEDVEAVRAYLAGGADAQHAAYLDIGVRFVLSRRAVDPHHKVLYPLGPWRDLELRPDLYRRIFRNSVGSLYEVLPK